MSTRHQTKSSKSSGGLITVRNTLLFAAVCVVTFFSSAFTFDNSTIVVYSKQQVYIGPRCEISSGSVQSETYALIDDYAEIKGSVFSGGNALLRNYVHVHSDVIAEGSITRQAAVIIDGSEQENGQTVRQEFETKTVPIGWQNVTVYGGMSKHLSPGNYKSVTVYSGGKLYLYDGEYNFKTLTTYWDAELRIDIAGYETVEVNVRDNMTFYDRTKTRFVTENNPNNVYLYSSQSGWLDIGAESNMAGMLSAPNAEIRLLARASWTGALKANKVSLMAESSINGILALDTDNDGVPDAVEAEAMTDPYDPASKPVELACCTWANRTGWGPQEIRYNYSRYPGYAYCTNVPLYLSSFSLEGEFIPVINLLEQDRSVLLEDYSFDGGKIQVIAGGRPKRDGRKVMMCFAVSDRSRGMPKEAVKLFRRESNADEWEEVEIDHVTYGAIYALVPEWGEYAVGVNDYAYVVDNHLSASVPDSNKYRSITEVYELLTGLTDSAQIAAQKYVFVCASDTPYVCDSLFVPVNTVTAGGFPAGFVLPQPDQIVESNPKDENYITKISPANLYRPALRFEQTQAEQDAYPSGDKEHLKMYNSRIEGIFFVGLKDSASSASDVYSGVGSLLIWGKWHVKNIRIRNCVFEKNIGRIAGAAFVCNASKVFFESCVFAENTSVSGGQMEDICAVDPDGITRCRSINSQNWSGSAVTVYEFDSCGAEVDFDGCIFWNNSTQFDLAPDPSAADAGGGTIAVFGGVISAGRAAGASRPVKIANCTFNNNHVVNGSVPASHCAGSVYKDSSALLTSLTPVVLMNTICYGNVNAGISELRNISLAGDSVSYCTNFHTFANPGTYQTFRIPEVSYCNVQDAFLGSSQNSIGNFNHNPCFEGDKDSNGVVKNDIYDVPNADKIWGTLDDGLVLSYWGRDVGGSVESNRTRNNGIFRGLPETKDSTLKDYYKPVFFDATGRPKLGDVDIGGYESVIKIMCVGDDNTQGTKGGLSDTAWCYRASLKDLLLEKHWNVDFCGSSELAPIGGTWHTELKQKIRLDPARNPGVTDKYDIQHESYQGARIETFTGSDSITTLLNNGKPDIVLLISGTININESDTVISNLDSKITLLVNSINDWMGDAGQGRNRNQRYFLLGNLPVNKDKTMNDYVSRFNAAINKNWNGKINDALVDVNLGMNNNMLSTDSNYRCNKTGLIHIAKKWLRALYK